MLLQLCQRVINLFDSNSRPNKIASFLQSMLWKPLIFSDLALIKCFHDAYFHRHMTWLMQSKDLTGAPGFQSHQMLVGCHILDYDLDYIEATMLNDGGNPYYEDFRRSLDNLRSESEREKQQTKAKKFVNLARKQLHKHFKQWADPQLLPAALLAEPPLANAIARIVLNFPKSEIPLTFKSKVHNDRDIDVVNFEAFASDCFGD